MMWAGLFHVPVHVSVRRPAMKDGRSRAWPPRRDQLVELDDKGYTDAPPLQDVLTTCVITWLGIVRSAVSTRGGCVVNAASTLRAGGSALAHPQPTPALTYLNCGGEVNSRLRSASIIPPPGGGGAMYLRSCGGSSGPGRRTRAERCRFWGSLGREPAGAVMWSDTQHRTPHTSTRHGPPLLPSLWKPVTTPISASAHVNTVRDKRSRAVVECYTTLLPPRELGNLPVGVIPLFSHVGIVQDDAARQRVFSGISRFPRPCIPALLHPHPITPSSALKTSLLRAAVISQLSSTVRLRDFIIECCLHDKPLRY
ncbi:hypothetical protein PR048_017284 [Dryococelus australis]|uniref:Uncharacterized protein n=1 Tax=Dryococelus australis TaxID=614101 RepID=A0ABQ9H932_9NEOP|nr:hypothetical protein PR048_017284 [Dryococelus australis]